jgi:hypothetical protein
VDDSKVALGERGPVWWTGGKPDFNRHFVKNTPYAKIAALDAEEQRIPMLDVCNTMGPRGFVASKPPFAPEPKQWCDGA